MRLRRRHAWSSSLAALVLTGAVLSGCSSEEAPEVRSSPNPSTSGESQGPQPARTLAEAGVSVSVPPGWNAVSLDPGSRQAAIDAEQDPQIKQFVSERLEGMAQTGGIMWLYDLRALDEGVLSAVEVYRYPGTDPQAIAQDTIVPKLAEAGLDPEMGTVDLPAGQATTVTGRVDQEGVSLTNEVTLLVVGPSVVSLSATFGDATEAEVQAVLGSVKAAPPA